MKQITRALAVLAMTLAHTVASAQSHPLNFNNMPLVGAVAIFAQAHNVRTQWDVDPPNTPFTGDLSQDTVETGFTKLLDPAYRFEPQGNVYHILGYNRQGQRAMPRSPAAPQQTVQPGRVYQPVAGGPQLVPNPTASIPVGMEQPYLEFGDPDYWFSPNHFGAEWLDGTTGLPAGWYKRRGRNTWAQFAYHPNELIRMSPLTRQRLAQLLFAPSFAMPQQYAGLESGLGIHAQAQIGLGNGPILQANANAGLMFPGGGYGGYGSYADSGWYGMPLFDFQLEEMRMQYQDIRRLAKLRVNGQNCGNDCLQNIHVLLILTDQKGIEKEFYLFAARDANNFYEDGVDVPINVQTNSAHLLIVNESSSDGTMLAVERNMIIMPRAVRDKDTDLTISPQMFANARKIRVLKQQILWETTPGKFESRPGSTITNTQARATLP